MNIELHRALISHFQQQRLEHPSWLLMLTRFMMLKVVSGFSVRAREYFLLIGLHFNSLFGPTIVDQRLTIRLVSANGKKGFPLGGIRGVP